MAGRMSQNKGKQGEREVAMLLRAILKKACLDNGYEEEAAERKANGVRRNSLQSANGGFDLVGVPGMAVEVKRQETLKVEEWWRQCVEQCKEENEREGTNLIPVLLFRQNGKQWRCLTWVWLPVDKKVVKVRGEIGMEEFKGWAYWLFRALVGQGQGG